MPYEVIDFLSFAACLLGVADGELSDGERQAGGGRGVGSRPGGRGGEAGGGDEDEDEAPTEDVRKIQGELGGGPMGWSNGGVSAGGLHTSCGLSPRVLAGWQHPPPTARCAPSRPRPACRTLDPAAPLPDTAPPPPAHCGAKP